MTKGSYGWSGLSSKTQINAIDYRSDSWKWFLFMQRYMEETRFYVVDLHGSRSMFFNFQGTWIHIYFGDMIHFSSFKLTIKPFDFPTWSKN